jgi:hypothetical protein
LDELRYPYRDLNEGGKERKYYIDDHHKKRSAWVLPVPKVEFDLTDKVILDYLLLAGMQNPGLSEQLINLRQKLGILGAQAGYSIIPQEPGVSAKRFPVLMPTRRLCKRLGPDGSQILNELITAIQQRNLTVVTYTAASTWETRVYRIQPLLLFEQAGGLYLYVIVERFKSFLLLAVERIKDIEILDETFEYLDGLDLQKRLDDPFGLIADEPFTAVLRFSADQAPYILERTWPSSCILDEQSDGTLIFTIETSGNYELSRWILSQGSEVEVLKPDWLRTQIAEELQSVLQKYGG